MPTQNKKIQFLNNLAKSVGQISWSWCLPTHPLADVTQMKAAYGIYHCRSGLDSHWIADNRKHKNSHWNFISIMSTSREIGLFGFRGRHLG